LGVDDEIDDIADSEDADKVDDDDIGDVDDMEDIEGNKIDDVDEIEDREDMDDDGSIFETVDGNDVDINGDIEEGKGALFDIGIEEVEIVDSCMEDSFSISEDEYEIVLFSKGDRDIDVNKKNVSL
jgi:hypothetical protein